VKRYGNYGKKVSWIVKRYGQYGRKASWIVKKDIEHREESKLNSENIWKIQNKIVKWYGNYGKK
jgi:hypothetical protein